jgi:VWFA-related protein
MKNRGLLFWMMLICASAGFIAWMAVGLTGVNAQQPESQSAPAAVQSSGQPQSEGAQTVPGGTVFRAQTKLVLVDSIVTDKKGNYIRDLTQKDFRVWEDNKEQEVKSFSYEAGSPSPSNPTKHYLVLFFDNSTMDFGDQAIARKAAAKFIDANAGPDRLIASVDFGGTLQITQNFTADTGRLKRMVAGITSAQFQPTLKQRPENEFADQPSLIRAQADFGARNMLLAVRDLAKDLSGVPGRKTLVLLTSGFPLTIEEQSDLTAAIDACNKANVAVYPIDVRGLVVGGNTGPGFEQLKPAVLWQAQPQLAPAVFHYAEETPHLVLIQHGGGGGGGTGGGHGGGGGTGGGGGGGGHGGGGGTGGGGGHGGGGTGGGHGGGTGSGGHGGSGGSTGHGYSPTSSYNANPNFQPSNLIPAFPQSASTNQQVLYALADGTGGFLIHDTNDLLAGMDRIGREQSEYYLLGYAPPNSRDGSCHTIKVKVDERKTIVRSRTGYCNVKPLDLLAGKPIERELEEHAISGDTSSVNGSMEAPFFYTSANVARVSLAMQVPSNAIKFEKEKGKFRSDINVLGIAKKADGTETARFSDTVHLEFEKKELEAFNKEPFVYQNQFDIASGQYQLSVIFSSGGESFGKLEAPLVVDSYDGKHFSLSSLALSKDAHPISEMDQGLDADLVQGNVPLVFHGLQIVPAADYHFKQKDPAVVYMEIYEPLLTSGKPPRLGLEMKIVDIKTGKALVDIGVTKTADAIKAGNPVVPMGLKLPVDRLSAGTYRLELKALDSAGNASPVRAAEFVVD